MKNKNPKIVIVMPAYNAERTVRDTFNEIPKHLRKNIILVDDKSKDNTVAVARNLGIKVFEHSNNLGYGGNQKTCYWEALKLKPDVVVMLHPDYQYDASLIEDLVKPILEGRYDFMFGSRIANKKGAIGGGMPLVKYYVNRIVCLVQNILLGVNFTEHFSGLRAFSGKLLREVPFQRFSNDFVFDQEMTISAISYNMRIGEIPIPTRYHEKQSSINFFKGTKFILDGFWTTFKYLLHKAGIVNDCRFVPKNFMKTKISKHALVIIFLGLIIIFFKPSASLNFWLWLFVFIQSVLLYFLMRPQPSKSIYKKFIFILLPLVIGIFISATGVYKDTFYISNFEKNQLWERRELYKRELGVIGRSNLGNMAIEKTKFYLDKLTYKVTEPFDLSRYFSADSSSIYHLIFFPLFIIGASHLLAYKIRPLFYYLGFAIVGAILAQPNMVYWLFVPLINLSVLFGLIKLWIKYKK